MRDYIPSLLILCGISALVTVDWICEEYRKFKARQKRRASKPIDYISFMYNCEGRIKLNGDELRKLTGGERRNGNEAKKA